MSIPKELLGRYEFQGTTDKGNESNKFWTIQPVQFDKYHVEWGKNGNGPQGSKLYSEIEAHKKIHEKIAKGYRLTGTLSTRKRHAPNELTVEKLVEGSELLRRMTGKPRKETEIKVEHDDFDFLKELRKIK